MVNCAPPITIAITITSLPCVRRRDQNLRHHSRTHARINEFSSQPPRFVLTEEQ
jgi:hypothetical protein